MTGYDTAAWESFFVANAGAAAALAGLVFVGVSINVDEIVSSQRLVGRAVEAFAFLVCVLVVSAVGLAPDVGEDGMGAAVLIVGLGLEAIAGVQQAKSLPRFGGETGEQVPRGSNLVRITMGQITALSFVVCGITLMAGSGGGLYWLVAAFGVGYISSLTNAWVLLIEIRR